jgi:hypothetical protein
MTESSSIREPSDIVLGGNDSFWIKRFFLSFLQAYFQQNVKYTWQANSQTTSIIIADKFAMDLDLAHKKPALVLSRGSMRWLNTSIGQKYKIDLLSGNTEYTDLLASSVTINCMAKNGLVAEELALVVRNILTAEREQLRSNGLHKINSIGIGEERSLSTSSEHELTVVPVTVDFVKQSNLDSIEDYYTTNVTITFDGSDYGGFSGLVFEDTTMPLQLFENRDYTVYSSGIIFASGMAPPSGAVINVSYIEAVSLAEVLDETPSGVVDDDNKTFSLTQLVYGYSPLLATVSISGILDA